MENREERIQQLMLNEITEKSLQIGITVSLFATFIFFYGFGLQENLLILRFACAGAVVASTLRFLVARLPRKSEFCFRCMVRACVVMSAVCWSTIFALPFIEHGMTLNLHQMLALAIMANFLSGSVTSLSGDYFCFFPFYVTVLGPAVAVTLWRAQIDPTYYVVTGVLFYMLVSHGVLAKEYRKLLRKRFSNKLDLQASYVLLQEQTEHMVQSSKLAALGEMAGGMAHEINNPLAIIALLGRRISSLLKKGPVDLPKIQGMLGEIEATVQRISRIVQGLRNVSRGSEDEEMRPALLKDIFEDVTGICSVRFQQSRIDFRITDEEKLLAETLDCQRVQISQVLINLLSNAIDAVGAGTEDRWVSLTVSTRGDLLRLSVSNGGALISDEVRRKLFQPFFTTKEIGKGTGLGLSISKKIVEAHCGTISLLETGPTTFVVELPRKRSLRQAS